MAGQTDPLPEIAVHSLSFDSTPCSEVAMPFSIRPNRRFPVPCSVTPRAGLSLRRPLACFSCFWLLITLVVLSRGPVSAEWVLVSGEHNTGLMVYVDPNTIRREGNLVKMSSLIDYKTIQSIEGNAVLSIERQNEYDCNEERTRMLASTWFSDNMKRGQVVHSDSDEDEWKPAAPGSIAQAMLNVACRRE